MTEIKVADNLAAIRDRVAAACFSAGRPQDAVRLVAVTKRVALPLVVEACRCGQLDLGENRLPEALDRRQDLEGALAPAGLAPSGLRWHFIGHLQSRKVNLAAGQFALLHGVDSLKLAARLSSQCVALGVKQAILLEVNISDEIQKNGFAGTEAQEAAGRCLELPGLDVQGFMGMGRYGADERELHAAFGGLSKLAEKARHELGAPFPELSMGMSGDFEIAIAEGATLVRVGTAIFGARQD